MLEIRQVAKEFTLRNEGLLEVFREISLTVRDGELVCLLGPSGCGKTTLLRLVAGLDNPTRGEILVNGQKITRPGADRGLIFQNYALFPWRTVWGNLEFGLEVRKIPKKQRSLLIQQYLSWFGLEEFPRAYPKELSGGMQQRVALARTLINEPEILLMDEPFAALDAQTRNDLQEFLANIWQRTRQTILFVTHNVDEAVFLATRIVVMTKRPAGIGITREINLKYPRDRTGVDFINVRRELLDFLSRQRNKKSERNLDTFEYLKN